VLYTRGRSLRSWRAKRFLSHSGYDFKVVDTTNDGEVRALLLQNFHHEVVLPYVFVDHRPVGDFGVIKALARSGSLEHLLRDEI
jgi:glutaredoxin-related protein